MKRTELSTPLRQAYSPSRGFGVEKVDRKDLENLWFVVPPAPPRKLPSDLPAHALARANQTLAALAPIGQASPLEQMVSSLLIRREAVQSSRMEGTWSTVAHVLTPGETYDRKEAKSERASVLGYAHALEAEIQRVHREGVAAISRPLVSRLHQEIMSKDPVYTGRPGQIREPGQPGDIVWIGPLGRPEDAIYNPAPPRHVNRCLGEVLEWLSDAELAELGNAGMGLPLPARMAIGHSHFEAVHPFPDGNGRVGRMIMTLQMAAHGVLPLYISGYIEAEKKEYGKSLQEAQKKLRYGRIVEFVSMGIVESHAEASRTQAAIMALPEKWKARGEFREGSAAMRMLPHLISRPIFTAKDIVETLQISPPAATRAVTQLVEKGIARQRTQGSWGRLFAVEEVIELLSRPFGETTETALKRAAQLLNPA